MINPMYAFSFDDILLVPQHTDIESRLDVDISTKLTKNLKISTPVISTNMSTITEAKMAKTMAKLGGAGFLHRFGTMIDNIMMVKELYDDGIHRSYPIIPSVGIKEDDREFIDYICKNDIYVDAVLIDIAHGDSDSVVRMIEYIKEKLPKVDVIAGNVATESGFMNLVNAGADAVRLGIGGGSCCTTRLVTGHGIPTLQSIVYCADASESTGIPIIADGGFKTSGDIVKALAFGASTVCLGNMLSATSDTPGDVLTLESGLFKEMYGMSSRKAQEKYKGGLKRGTAAEGLDRLVPYKGDTTSVMEEILGGIRSGLTYSGARNIKELRENFDFVILSPGSMKESKMA